MKTSTDETLAAPASRILPKHIVAPVDFSQPCLHGLTAAIDLARRFQAKLTLVHVVKHLPHGSHVVMDAVGISQDWKRPAVERLAAFVAEHVPADVAVQQVVTTGKPFHEIVQVAAEQGADLIVIATHGYTGLAHVLIGSNAERIVQHAPCPVLIMRGRPSDATPPSATPTAFHWIITPTDFSINSCKAFPMAEAMAHEFHAKLTLLHVLPSLLMPVELSGEIPILKTAQEILIQHAQVEVQLRQFRTQYFSTRLDTTTLVVDGVPYQMICEVAKAEELGLIIMATQGQTAFQHALIGSTAERVVQHAPCPVLVVR
jgi:nucleotide-binding universal stress UspA family protein